MLTLIAEIRFPEVVYQMPKELWQYPKIIHGLCAALWMYPVEGQHVCACYMKPMKFSGNPCAAFIDMKGRDLMECGNNDRFERCKLIIAAVGGLRSGSLTK